MTASVPDGDRPERASRLRSWRDRGWPQLRAALIALHLVAITVLSLPSLARMDTDGHWRKRHNLRELNGWTRRLRGLRIDVTEDALRSLARAGASSYEAVRKPLAQPAHLYTALTGVEQRWGMFSRPRRQSFRLEVAVRREGWKTVYRSCSSEHRWLAGKLEHNRMRRLQRLNARKPRMFRGLVRVLAARARKDFPGASHLRVTFHRVTAVEPERRRAGEMPELEKVRERTVALSP